MSDVDTEKDKNLGMRVERTEPRASSMNASTPNPLLSSPDVHNRKMKHPIS